MYEYNAKVDRVVDGDTVDVIIELGFKMTTHQRIRLAGIDAPERQKTATEALENYLGDGQITIETNKTGKYGRYIGTIFNSSGASVNQMMLDGGFAETYK